ncbi:MAG: DUF4186 domain-containing protein [Bacilli bacterium]|nr:DUF4186 domain-containing protein [Bacilli bacterium]
MQNNIDSLLDSLSRAKFRGSFHLNNKMKEYVETKGIEKIRKDAYEIISKRIQPAIIPNDGKQTPMKQVHPVFIGQHATGTCCRSCLSKIHHIDSGRELCNEEVDYIVNVVMKWIEREII